MNKIKELTDFYMWMQENDYDHNIKSRVENKAEMYLNGINVGQKLPIHNVVGSADSADDWDDDEEGNDGCCDDCGCYHGHHPWCGESDEIDDDW